MSMMSGDTGAIAQVQPGMRVVDADGIPVGTVKDITMGDPDAVTTQGQGAETDLAAEMQLGASRHEPHVDRSRLVRTGYVVVGRRGLFRRPRFAGAEDISAVDHGVVRLAVPSARLAR